MTYRIGDVVQLPWANAVCYGKFFHPVAHKCWSLFMATDGSGRSFALARVSEDPIERENFYSAASCCSLKVCESRASARRARSDRTREIWLAEAEKWKRRARLIERLLFTGAVGG